ncbi:MAG: hypothetical protein K2X27_11810 [Candidatus Obscuribacterales bacterium]|nr:hypothetical protein [Candidatus Obscuribacterales bacterium]
MSSGVKARADKGPQPIKIYWLIEELKKRKIPQRPFAQRLGIIVNVLNGTAGIFPADKVEECMRLLENWQAPQPVNAGGRKGDSHPWQGPMLAKGKRL